MVSLSGTYTYQYDPLYQLTHVTYPSPQTDAYTYDANGNRLVAPAGRRSPTLERNRFYLT